MTDSEALPFSQLARVYDAIFADVEYAEWFEFTLTLLKSRDWIGNTAKPASVRVLDLACGTGSSTKPFADYGFDVVGADFSEAMLEVARKKLPNTHFYRQSFLDLQLDTRFSLILSVFDSLNNLTNPVDLERAFGRIFDHLERGGWFVFDANTRVGVRELWDDDRFEGEVKTEDGIAAFVWTHYYDGATDLGHITARVQSWTDAGLNEFTEEHVERGYDPQEMTVMLEAQGFVEIAFFEYPDQAVPSTDSPRVWGIAHKPNTLF